MLSDRCVSFLRSDSVVADVRETAGVTEVWLRGDIDLASRSGMIDDLSRLFGRDERVIRVDLASGDVPRRVWDRVLPEGAARSASLRL